MTTTQTKDVSTSSAGTLTVPAMTAPSGLSGGLAPALPPGATVSRGVAATLRQLADRHNKVHGDDRKKRADLRALRAAYRRGAAKKPPAGRTRRDGGLARVQAHLAALAGKELPAEYAADRDLLPGEEKRLAVLVAEGGETEPADHLKALGVEVEGKQAAETVETETKTWSDEARAAALAARQAREATESPGAEKLSELAHAVTAAGGDHEEARQAHLAAATAHKAAGDEHAALAHLSLADHHRDQAALEKDGIEHPTAHPVGSRVQTADGKAGEVVAHGTNGAAVKHDDGKVTMHDPASLTPAESQPELRGAVPAGQVRAGDFVWDHTTNGHGYRAETVEHAHGFTTITHRDPVHGGINHRYHPSDATLRIVRAAT